MFKNLRMVAFSFMQDFAIIFLMRVTKTARRILKEFLAVFTVVVVVVAAVAVASVAVVTVVTVLAGVGWW